MTGTLAAVEPGLAEGIATETARDVLSQAKYRVPGEGILDRLIAQVRAWFAVFVDRLTEALGGPLTAGVVALAVVVVAGLIAFRHLARRRAATIERELTFERLMREGGDPHQLEREAERAAAEGRYGAAVRQTFLAGLLRLDLAGAIRFDPGLTTGEIAETLADPVFDRLTRQFEDVVYGGREVDAAGWQAARSGWGDLLAAGATRR